MRLMAYTIQELLKSLQSANDFVGGRFTNVVGVYSLAFNGKTVLHRHILQFEESIATAIEHTPIPKGFSSAASTHPTLQP